jgi:aromatic ring-opening dioxygenase catalytic subunit (LigB family)
MTSKFPVIFCNHGGGPLPLLGQQPALVRHWKEIPKTYLNNQRPSSIVVISAHWESSPVQILSSPNPSMLYDYHGFPPETYKYSYPAPGSPALAQTIQDLLHKHGIASELNAKRGFDHGVFVPLMIMYPNNTDIPVVSVSLDASMDARANMRVGEALAPLRDQGVLILGSGYTFHNMRAFFNPTRQTLRASALFDEWLQTTVLNKSAVIDESVLDKLANWQEAPGNARLCHPREEHLLPLFMAATAAKGSKSVLIYHEDAKDDNHAVSGFLFR